MNCRESEWLESITYDRDKTGDDFGLDVIEQQRSLERASNPDFAFEFCGLPWISEDVAYKMIELEQKTKQIPHWEKQRVQAFCRKLGYS